MRDALAHSVHAHIAMGDSDTSLEVAVIAETNEMSIVGRYDTHSVEFAITVSGRGHSSGPSHCEVCNTHFSVIDSESDIDHILDHGTSVHLRNKRILHMGHGSTRS